MVHERKPALEQNLIDAGCADEIIEQFFSLAGQGKAKELMALLNRQRLILLTRVRGEQRCLDCLDYLINKMKPVKKEKT